MTVAIIAAVADNGVIGKDNAIPWHLPEDFKHFKATTMGSPVVMGRKTFESLGRPLPGRLNLVVSRSGFLAEGIEPYPSLETALAAAIARSEKVFIIGGTQIYTEALRKNLVDELIISRIHGNFEGDSYFPSYEKKDWTLSTSVDYEGFTVENYSLAKEKA